MDVGFAALADVSALLVTERGVVRSDNDFVFYNQPTGPGVQLKPGPGRMARLHIVTGQVPADIAAVRTVITLDDAGLRFGQFPAPIARILDVAGNELYSYTIEGLSSESVVVAIEIYRRGNQWKVRAPSGRDTPAASPTWYATTGQRRRRTRTTPPAQAPRPVATPAPITGPGDQPQQEPAGQPPQGTAGNASQRRQRRAHRHRDGAGLGTGPRPLDRPRRIGTDVLRQ